MSVNLLDKKAWLVIHGNYLNNGHWTAHSGIHHLTWFSHNGNTCYATGHDVNRLYEDLYDNIKNMLMIKSGVIFT